MKKLKWLPYYRFKIINGNLTPSIVELCRTLTRRWRSVWIPGGPLVIDESIYEYLGECPTHVHIPRKPHEDGLLAYGLSGYSSILKLPILLDLEPYVKGNVPTARISASLLADRLLEAHPTLKPHIVMDSLFGSFKDIHYYHLKGISLTVSMAENKKPWLWHLLGHRCPLDAGRAALFPLDAPEQFYIASYYRTQTEAGKRIDIRTASSAFKFREREITEWVVTSIGARRRSRDGFFEYETHWAGGAITWQQANLFVDEDGTFNIKWLEKAEDEDIQEALSNLHRSDLISICEQKHWKVSY
ncbi:MAG TPA: hypothetical protein VGD26_10700 [Chitinophagaceae bacterium]